MALEDELARVGLRFIYDDGFVRGYTMKQKQSTKTRDGQQLLIGGVFYTGDGCLIQLHSEPTGQRVRKEYATASRAS